MKWYGLVGKTLLHSFSQKFFTEKFAQEGITGCVYRNFELEHIGLLPRLLAQHPNLYGLNVTIPYKESVLPFLTAHSAVVQNVGACNCIQIEDGKAIGHNTDVSGFTAALQPLLQVGDDRALILGRGGASKAIQYALRNLGIAFEVVSRSASDGLDYTGLTREMVAAHPLIINTTPLGTYPRVDECPPIPYEAIGDKHLLFDLVYNPAQTLFLKQGMERGARTANGYEMLVAQALHSWDIWNPL